MSLFSTVSKSLLGLTLVAAATSGHALSIVTLLHAHTHAITVSTLKATLTLSNPNLNFRDVVIQNETYTILPHHSLVINAPVGTPVYAGNRMFRAHAKGSVVAEVENGSRTVAVD